VAALVAEGQAERDGQGDRYAKPGPGPPLRECKGVIMELVRNEQGVKPQAQQREEQDQEATPAKTTLAGREASRMEFLGVAGWAQPPVDVVVIITQIIFGVGNAIWIGLDLPGGFEALFRDKHAYLGVLCRGCFQGGTGLRANGDALEFQSSAQRGRILRWQQA
jgi:hypothetical protein